jgi:hypothetical protein
MQHRNLLVVFDLLKKFSGNDLHGIPVTKVTVTDMVKRLTIGVLHPLGDNPACRQNTNSVQAAISLESVATLSSLPISGSKVTMNNDKERTKINKAASRSLPI